MCANKVKQYDVVMKCCSCLGDPNKFISVNQQVSGSRERVLFSVPLCQKCHKKYLTQKILFIILAAVLAVCALGSIGLHIESDLLKGVLFFVFLILAWIPWELARGFEHLVSYKEYSSDKMKKSSPSLKQQPKGIIIFGVEIPGGIYKGPIFSNREYNTMFLELNKENIATPFRDSREVQ